jgi:hypothetical protein
MELAVGVRSENWDSEQTNANVGFFFVESFKIKPKLSCCIHGSWFVPQSIEIIESEIRRKKTFDSMEI